MYGISLTLRGDYGVLLVGYREWGRFGPWSLQPTGGGVTATLLVTNEESDAYLSTYAPTAVRIHFTGPTRNGSGPTLTASPTPISVPVSSSDDDCWWLFAKVNRLGPGVYQVEGMPEVR
jgi:hypothetical protein